mmetsp:Transcript_1316/g.4228  ORF Transcript_1316/g.4228 Transcript_1316/m.4228 type:complete len:608 (+) Transcript_1316:194-2017(+)
MSNHGCPTLATPRLVILSSPRVGERCLPPPRRPPSLRLIVRHRCGAQRRHPLHRDQLARKLRRREQRRRAEEQVTVVCRRSNLVHAPHLRVTRAAHHKDEHQRLAGPVGASLAPQRPRAHPTCGQVWPRRPARRAAVSRLSYAAAQPREAAPPSERGAEQRRQRGGVAAEQRRAGGRRRLRGPASASPAGARPEAEEAARHGLELLAVEGRRAGDGAAGAVAERQRERREQQQPLSLEHLLCLRGPRRLRLRPRPLRAAGRLGRGRGRREGRRARRVGRSARGAAGARRRRGERVDKGTHDAGEGLGLLDCSSGGAVAASGQILLEHHELVQRRVLRGGRRAASDRRQRRGGDQQRHDALPHLVRDLECLLLPLVRQRREPPVHLHHLLGRELLATRDAAPRLLHRLVLGDEGARRREQRFLHGVERLEADPLPDLVAASAPQQHLGRAVLGRRLACRVAPEATLPQHAPRLGERLEPKIVQQRREEVGGAIDEQHGHVPAPRRRRLAARPSRRLPSGSRARCRRRRHQSHAERLGHRVVTRPVPHRRSRVTEQGTELGELLGCMRHGRRALAARLVFALQQPRLDVVFVERGRRPVQPAERGRPVE